MYGHGKRDQPEHGGAEASPAGGGAPGKQTLTSNLAAGAGGSLGGIQLKRSDGAPQGAPAPADAFAHATSGAGSELPYRPQLESAFGADLGGVTAHLGGTEAQQGLSGLGARAAAHGNSVAFAEASPSLGLVAHETAHVIQQGASGGGGVQRKPVGVSAPGNDAEARADAAADAVVAGLPVPDVGTAPADDIHRAVETSGGSWSTPTYSARASGTGAVGDRVGCSIELHFTPNELVEAPADGIGITQSVKSMKSTTRGGARDTFAPPSDPGKAMVTLGAGSGDPGRGIDRNIYPSDPGGPGGARAIPNTNPMYGVYNPGAGAGGVSTSLNDNTPSVGATQFGSHVRKPDGTFEAPVDAVLDDSPNRRLESEGQTFEQTFEATALVMSGPLANTYLGSVAWGYASTEDGVSNLTPPAITVVSQGNPSALFNEAATKWNDAQLPDRSDPTAPLIDTVNLPIDNARRPGEMTTQEIFTALSTIDAEIAALAGAEASRKQLFKRGLENEARNRSLCVSVQVRSTEDWTGADEVYVKLKNGGRQTASPERSLNDGQSFVFRVPLTTVFGPNPSFEIEVYDGDWPDGDDLLVRMTMPAPYAPVTNARTLDGADYAVRAYFD
jgi:hypothetical protein